MAHAPNPVPDSRIRFEIWLPDPNTWNGKLLGTGNGGFDGVRPPRGSRSGGIEVDLTPAKSWTIASRVKPRQLANWGEPR